jgi:hypothetical protein
MPKTASMNRHLLKLVLRGALPGLFALVACSVTPSRAPLGGNYAVADPEPSRDHRAHQQDMAKVPEPEPDPQLTAATLAKVATAPALADVSVAAPSTDTLRYEPLKTGDQIKGEMTVAFKAQMESGGRGVLPGNGFAGVDAKFKIDLKITRASAQTLDELEMTMTPISLKTEFGGHTSELPQASAKTFDITLAGQSPNVRERGGDKLTAEERAILMVIVTPLTDFHERWTRSPTLELKPGWSAKAPVSVPSFMSASSDTMHIGPFAARYTGRDGASDQVPFQIALPIQYGTELGKLDFDLTGIARLSAAKARPMSIDLSGPVSGGGGPHGELNFHGSAKFAATLSYL